MNKKLKLALALVFASGIANAGQILSGGTVISNTMGVYPWPHSPVTDMLDQSGLSANYVSGVTNFATFTSSGVTHSGGDMNSWLSASGVYSGSLIFDLGAAYNVQQFAMWNGASGISASVARFSLETSLLADFSVSNAVGSFTGHQSHYGATVYDMTDTYARYVRMNIAGNFGNGCCTAIGDIAFDVTQGNNVPEPIGAALVGLGLVGLGAIRRRKAKIAA